MHSQVFWIEFSFFLPDCPEILLSVEEEPVIAFILQYKIVGSKVHVCYLFTSLRNTADWLHSVFSSVVKSMGVPARFWFYVFFLISDCQSRYFAV